MAELALFVKKKVSPKSVESFFFFFSFFFQRTQSFLKTASYLYYNSPRTFLVMNLTSITQPDD